jgi:hypothetical protein
MKKKIKKIIIKIDRYLDSVIPRWFTFFTFIMVVLSFAYVTDDFTEFELAFQNIYDIVKIVNPIILIFLVFVIETSFYNLAEFIMKYFNKKPFTRKDYILAKREGYDLYDFNDYEMYFGLGEEERS